MSDPDGSTEDEPLPEDRLDTMREKAQELLADDGLESFVLSTVTSEDLLTVAGSQMEMEYPNHLMGLYGIADAISEMTKMDPRMNGKEPWEVAQWAFHFRNEHAEFTGDRELHPISGRWDDDDTDDSDSDPDPDVMTDGGEDVEDSPPPAPSPDSVNREDEPPDFPKIHVENYRTFYTDFVTAPEAARDDREHYDYNHRYPGSLGRVSLDVEFVGPDGFREMTESLVGPAREVLSESYGGIDAVQDACGDYVAFSTRTIRHSPEDVDDVMAVSPDPLVAAAAVRMWYDKQFGQQSYMTRRNDKFRNERRREEKREWKQEGVTVEYSETEDARDCESCSTTIPDGARVWSITKPPGREYTGQCTVCARSKVQDADLQDWNLNGPDPREYTREGEPVTDGGADIPVQFTVDTADISGLNAAVIDFHRHIYPVLGEDATLQVTITRDPTEWKQDYSVDYSEDDDPVDALREAAREYERQKQAIEQELAEVLSLLQSETGDRGEGEAATDGSGLTSPSDVREWALESLYHGKYQCECGYAEDLSSDMDVNDVIELHNSHVREDHQDEGDDPDPEVATDGGQDVTSEYRRAEVVVECGMDCSWTTTVEWSDRADGYTGRGGDDLPEPGQTFEGPLTCPRCEENEVAHSDLYRVTEVRDVWTETVRVNTDGGEDVLTREDITEPSDEEIQKYRERREYFTCPECDTVADVRLDAEQIHRKFWKVWAEVHHVRRGDGPSEVYIHVDEDEVDRGRELRELLAPGCEDVTVDSDADPPEDDRPDLDAYHRTADRQGRGPHTGRPRTDGGSDVLAYRREEGGSVSPLICPGCESEIGGGEFGEDATSPLTTGDLSNFTNVTCAICEAAILRNGEPVSADGGEDPDAAEMVPIPKWEQKARGNVDKWGQQDADALFLAMIEEFGEMATDLLLASEYADGDMIAEEGRDFLRRVRALGDEVQDFLETVTEDSNGDPIPAEERPNYLTWTNAPHGKMYGKRTEGELDDLMALGYQFQWALDYNAPHKGGDEGGE